MISEKIFVGGILVIFWSKSQVVPYDKFSEKPSKLRNLRKKNHILTTPPIIISLNHYLSVKDSWEKFLSAFSCAQHVFFLFVVDIDLTPLYP